MFTLLQIVLSQHCETCGENSNPFLWDLGKDYILPILFAGLAAFVAWYIFVRETRRDKTNEENRKIQETNDKLIFFAALVDSALRASIQQKDHIKAHIRAIRANDVEFHLMTFVPLYDLKRITETLDLESYLLAFVNHYSTSRLQAVKDFKNIMLSIDFLYENFKQLIDQLERSQKYDYERKTRLQDNFATTFNLTGNVFLILQANDPASLIQLQVILDDFAANNPGNNYDLTFYHDNFFVPVNDFCVAYMGTGRPHFPAIINLATYTRDGKQLYEQIKSENQYLKDSLVTQLQNILSSIAFLRTQSRSLISDFLV